MSPTLKYQGLHLHFSSLVASMLCIALHSKCNRTIKYNKANNSCHSSSAVAAVH